MQIRIRNKWLTGRNRGDTIVLSHIPKIGQSEPSSMFFPIHQLARLRIMEPRNTQTRIVPER